MMATYIYAVKVNLATFLCCEPEEEARLMWFAKKNNRPAASILGVYAEGV